MVLNFLPLKTCKNGSVLLVPSLKVPLFKACCLHGTTPMRPFTDLSPLFSDPSRRAAGQSTALSVLRSSATAMSQFDSFRASWFHNFPHTANSSAADARTAACPAARRPLAHPPPANTFSYYIHTSFTDEHPTSATYTVYYMHAAKTLIQSYHVTILTVYNEVKEM